MSGEKKPAAGAFGQTDECGPVQEAVVFLTGGFGRENAGVPQGTDRRHILASRFLSPLVG